MNMIMNLWVCGWWVSGGGGAAARKCANKLMFKPFKIIFNEERGLLGCKVMYFGRNTTLLLQGRP
jgi:hypothetical protein